MSGTGVIILKIYLLAGLVFHKLLWEIMKRRQGGIKVTGTNTLKSHLVKLVKLAILIGIIAQTLLPDILPIVR